ncbi:MAG TPA: biotin carboxylase N-terminal domain-containing protein [Fimbriimonadaceae bacterium]|nr:biotin carboxylase N-terminal domain-containing protein [Fimbriimonadaceae bacterium]HRJ33369.1 biotin carboxylase N-terminal domain-containing protein [Fimbriimonadaceae bacterium]
MIRKLLIANRGEIAVRILRAAREMGIQTVAVYSDADAHAMHRLLADEAVALGPSESSESYLVIDKILQAAEQTGADAIHPGYGFLSERAEFAQACADRGIRFVGPPPSAMRALGEKIDAKALAVQENVPITPGVFDRQASPEQLLTAAVEIGFPVMLKASAGGGGRGMRIVREKEAFLEEFRIASDEALKAFGDGAMMVEKLIERPRHVEVQILADSHGQVAALFERECSIQRRHQKLIEEATSPILEAHPELWSAMREASIRLARAAGYVGAGTVEFMVDEADLKFYFLEVNARLQVEHPVTELITGTDLVQAQLRIAAGERLDLPAGLLAGERSAISGHSIEARVVAEDPARNFLPSSGKILAWAEPKAPGVRVDTGYGPGGEIPRFYDSLIAKVIVHAPTRPQAIARLRDALRDFHILGVKTNISYLLDVLDHPEFQAGRIDTGFLGREFANWDAQTEEIPDELGSILACASPVTSASNGATTPADRDSVWSLGDGWRIHE